MGHARLRRSDDVRAVLRRGRRHAGRTLVVHALDRHDERPARVAVIASRRVGTAVERNRAKRVLRAAASGVPLPAGTDLALVARAATRDADAGETTRDLERAIERLFDSVSTTATRTGPAS